MDRRSSQLFSATLIAATALLPALTPDAAQGQAMLKGGLSYANVSNDGALPGNPEGQAGLTLGLALSTPTSQLFGAGLEAMYTQRGVGSTTSLDSYALDYIDLPVYLKVALPFSGLAPYAYAGPQMSVEVRCRLGDAPCPDRGRPRVSYAGIIGAGIQLGSRHAVSLEGRYVYGLKDLNLGTVTSANSYKNRSFELILGLGLGR